VTRAKWQTAHGTAADFRGRDVAGKAVMIYSIATPGGRDLSDDWSAYILGLR
jgi:hypothetical protein